MFQDIRQIVKDEARNPIHEKSSAFFFALLADKNTGKILLFYFIVYIIYTSEWIVQLQLIFDHKWLPF